MKIKKKKLCPNFKGRKALDRRPIDNNVRAIFRSKNVSAKLKIEATIFFAQSKSP